MRQVLKDYLVVILHLFDGESDIKSAEREEGGGVMHQSFSAGGGHKYTCETVSP